VTQPRTLLLNGVQFVSTDLLPTEPPPATEAERIVRHGLADVLAWLGDPVGPAPNDPIHAVALDPTHVMVSRDLWGDLKGQALTPDIQSHLDAMYGRW
jgi:hypothetical protein